MIDRVILINEESVCHGYHDGNSHRNNNGNDKNSIGIGAGGSVDTSTNIAGTPATTTTTTKATLAATTTAVSDPASTGTTTTSTTQNHNKTSCYRDAQIEKKTRAALKSAFDRSMAEATKSTLVILDSLNYIKGFRYELYCISKAAKQRYGVLWVINDIQTCMEWNRPNMSYTNELLEELIQRYEPPDDRNRWDKPLYQVDLRPNKSNSRNQPTSKGIYEKSVYNMHNLRQAVLQEKEITIVTPQTETLTVAYGIGMPPAPAPRVASAFKRAAPSKASASTIQHESPMQISPMEQKDCHAIRSTADPSDATMSLEQQIDAILQSFLSEDVKPLEEGTSTRQQIPGDANCLHTVDVVTQRICSSMNTIQSQSASVVSQFVLAYSPSNAGDTILWKAPGQRRISLIDLKRLRRQYIQWIQTHPPEEVSERGIAESFLAYIAEAQSR